MEQDKITCEQILTSLEPHNNKSTAELVVLTGKLLLNSPYKEHTLEASPEHLIINMREFDCTTFAENCLAIARAAKSKKPGFEEFTRQLQLIRYRDGRIEGYPSRLHYFSDWITNNDRKRTVNSLSKTINQIPFDKTINFMSQHPQSYSALNGNVVFLQTIIKQENALTKSPLYFIPTEKINELKHLLKNGDIFGITTNIEGLDIIHAGIVLFKENELHFMHASSSAEKVIISETPLYDYLVNRKTATGIMVARPL
ncbi:MAG TPA: N-acetylmuramoyl-L-alanine amidase-like domain-containing protein [Draconibacterium sp.]|nr:N-acetylmuramoyl-L-alanine amidase-like domain-containing protein [Draconibacterium sp.]